MNKLKYYPESSSISLYECKLVYIVSRIFTGGARVALAIVTAWHIHWAAWADFGLDTFLAVTWLLKIAWSGCAG